MCLILPYNQKSEVTDETGQILETELFDTLDDLFAKFDNPLVHLALDGIILKFRRWVDFSHCILEKHNYF
jgi:hypothetical protein